MSRKPSQETTSAWTRLVRVQQGLLASVESDLKKAGFPPLAWYDALLELSRSQHGALRPVELEIEFFGFCLRPVIVQSGP